MKKHTEPMMDYCEFFATEEEAIAACREVNRGLNSDDPQCCIVVDGPEDNYAVVLGTTDRPGRAVDIY
jgi:hypothetical protein